MGNISTNKSLGLCVQFVLNPDPSLLPKTILSLPSPSFGTTTRSHSLHNISVTYL